MNLLFSKCFLDLSNFNIKNIKNIKNNVFEICNNWNL